MTAAVGKLAGMSDHHRVVGSQRPGWQEGIDTVLAAPAFEFPAKKRVGGDTTRRGH
jgi:hypothetical protein